MSSFILVLHPHQRPGEVYIFHSEQEMLDAWLGGMFKEWHADNSGDIEDREPTLADAISDIGHDLSGLTMIMSVEELQEWLTYKRTGHNFPYRKVREAAEQLGWIDGDDEDQGD